MNVVLAYPAEHDKGEGIHLRAAFRQNGHEVIAVNHVSEVKSSLDAHASVLAFRPDTKLETVLEKAPGAELFVYVEPLGLLPRGMERSPIPTACVISDVHRNLKARRLLARLFDHVFLYQRNYLQAFDEHPSGAVSWSPWACNPTPAPLIQERDLDVAFIGQLWGPGSERRRILDRLSQNYRVNELRAYEQSEIPQIYGRARVVINLPLSDDLNWRTFEALGSGALLCTRRQRNGLDLLFAEGTHYVGFDSNEELFQKVSYYLNHETERATIAAAGQAEALARHTWSHRAEAMLKAVADGPRNTAPVRRMHAAAVVKTYAAIYERSGWIEALMRMAATERKRPVLRSHLLAMGLKSFCRRAVLKW